MEMRAATAIMRYKGAAPRRLPCLAAPLGGSTCTDGRRRSRVRYWGQIDSLKIAASTDRIGKSGAFGQTIRDERLFPAQNSSIKTSATASRHIVGHRRDT
jgi:hypothetical protein